MTYGKRDLALKWDLETEDWVIVAEGYIQNERSYLAAVAIPSDFELECF